MNIDEALKLGRDAGKFFDIDCFNYVLDLGILGPREVSELIDDARRHRYLQATCGHFIPDKDDWKKPCEPCGKSLADCVNINLKPTPALRPPSPEELQRMLDEAKRNFEKAHGKWSPPWPPGSQRR